MPLQSLMRAVFALSAFGAQGQEPNLGPQLVIPPQNPEKLVQGTYDAVLLLTRKKYIKC